MAARILIFDNPQSISHAEVDIPSISASRLIADNSDGRTHMLIICFRSGFILSPAIRIPSFWKVGPDYGGNSTPGTHRGPLLR
jgi:hypothetical protein